MGKLADGWSAAGQALAEALAQVDVEDRWHYYEQLAGVERSVPYDAREDTE